jgi:hypothetical protein
MCYIEAKAKVAEAFRQKGFSVLSIAESNLAGFEIKVESEDYPE